MINNPPIPPVDQFRKIGVPASKVKDTAYQALTDGFVEAYLQTSAQNNVLIGYTDANASPTTIVQKLMVYPSDAFECICFVVKKGDYWKVTTTSTNTPVIKWIPLELATTE